MITPLELHVFVTFHCMCQPAVNTTTQVSSIHMYVCSFINSILSYLTLLAFALLPSRSPDRPQEQ
jgi:hypothetical protein